MINFFKKKNKLEGNYEDRYAELIRRDRRKNWFIVFLMFFLFVAIRTASKPPLVIRLYEDGKTGISKNYNEASKITKMDVKIFIEKFIKNRNLTDSFGLEDRLPTALSMMDKNLRLRYKNDVLTEENLKKVEGLQWQSKTKILRRKTKTKGNNIYVTVRYVREIYDRKNNTKFNINFHAEVVCRVLAMRTEEYPHGLAVIQFDAQELD